MNVSIHSSIDQMSPAAYDNIRCQVKRSLLRFRPKITHATVLVSDENGPRGGVDKQCRVNVRMPGLGEVSTVASHENIAAAASKAVRRARQIVVSKLKRSKTSRLRRNFDRRSESLG